MSYLDFQKTLERLTKSGRGIRRSGTAFLSYRNHSLRNSSQFSRRAENVAKVTLYMFQRSVFVK